MFKDNCFFEGIKLYIQEQSAGLQQQNPESRLWIYSGNKSILVKVGGRS